MSAVLAAIICGCFVTVVVVDYQPQKLMAVLFPLFWLLLLPWHEAGHAVVAGLVGWYVHEVVIGWGRPLKRFRWGRATIEIRTLPLEGFVRSAPTNMSLPRLKCALVYFAGPGAELLILGVLLAALGLDALLTASDNYYLIVAQSLALAIVASAFVNLVPHAAVSAGGESFANDGLCILQSFFKPDSHFRAMLRGRITDAEDDI
jgi:hypothetical protein